MLAILKETWYLHGPESALVFIETLSRTMQGLLIKVWLYATLVNYHCIISVAFDYLDLSCHYLQDRVGCILMQVLVILPTSDASKWFSWPCLNQRAISWRLAQNAAKDWWIHSDAYLFSHFFFFFTEVFFYVRIHRLGNWWRSCLFWAGVSLTYLYDVGRTFTKGIYENWRGCFLIWPSP